MAIATNDRFDFTRREVDSGFMSPPASLDRARPIQPRPTASLTIEPLGIRNNSPRAHAAHCEVCAAVLVECKRWTAELVTRGRRP